MSILSARFTSADQEEIRVIASTDDGCEATVLKKGSKDFDSFLKENTVSPWAKPITPVITAPRWKVRAVLKAHVLDGETVSTFDKIEAVIADALANSAEGAHVLYEAWNNASDIASDSAIVAGLLSRFPLTNDDVYDIIQKANKITG